MILGIFYIQVIPKQPLGLNAKIKHNFDNYMLSYMQKLLRTR